MTSPLQHCWDAVIDESTPLEVRINAVKNYGKALKMAFKQPASAMEANHQMVAFQQWFRQQDAVDMISAGLSVFERLKLVSTVDVMVDLGLASYPAVVASAPVDDEHLALRTRAVKLLGVIGDRRAVIPLMSLLNNRQENYRLRMAAAESLGRLGDQHAVESLVGILRNDEESSVYLRESSARALGMLGDLRAMDALLEVLNSKQGLRNKMNFLKEQAIQSIGNLLRGEQAEKDVMNSLVSALNDEAASIRQAAIEAIGELDDPQWISVLIARLRDKEPLVVETAVASIYQLGGDEALERLLMDDNLPKSVREDIQSYLDEDGD